METAKRAGPVGGAPAFSRPLVAAACALYGATVAARLGGSWRELVAAAVVALVCGGLQGNALLRCRADLGKTFVTATAATLAALLLVPVLSPRDLGGGLFGGLAVLAPAGMVALATREMAGRAGRAGEPGAQRFGEAWLRLIGIALGLSAGFAINTQLPPTAPPAVSAVEGVSLGLPLVLGLLAVGGLALTVCLQARWRDSPWIVAGILVAYAMQTLTAHAAAGNTFLAAFCLGAIAMVESCVSGRRPALMIVPGLMQLGTTAFGTEATIRLVAGGAVAGGATLLHALCGAVELAGGLIAAEAAFGRRPPGGA